MASLVKIQHPTLVYWKKVEEELKTKEKTAQEKWLSIKDLQTPSATNHSFQKEIEILYLTYQRVLEAHLRNLQAQQSKASLLITRLHQPMNPITGDWEIKELANQFYSLQRIEIAKNYKYKIPPIEERIHVLSTQQNPASLDKDWWNGIRDIIPNYINFK